METLFRDRPAMPRAEGSWDRTRSAARAWEYLSFGYPGHVVIIRAVSVLRTWASGRTMDCDLAFASACLSLMMKSPRTTMQCYVRKCSVQQKNTTSGPHWMRGFENLRSRGLHTSLQCLAYSLITHNTGAVCTLPRQGEGP